MAAAPDGSPVELYALLPPLGEPELIASALRPAAEILELGCGAGRITHALVSLGFAVVAVDDSAEMLAHVRGAETVQAEIQTLDLGRRFGCVLLASNFVNDADEAHRDALLAACARHVRPDGVVLIQGFPDGWEPSEEETRAGTVMMRLRDGWRDGPLVGGVMEYSAGGRRWEHAFTSRLLDEAELDAALALAGLVRRRYLDPARSWVEAAPAPRG